MSRARCYSPTTTSRATSSPPRPRNPNDHLACSIRKHFCLGAGFARLEIKAIFQQLLKRLPNIHATDEPERLNSNFVAGIKRLPVEFTPEG